MGRQWGRTFKRMLRAPQELCWRCARRGQGSPAAVVCCFCHEWVCRQCFDDGAGICRTCAADEWREGYGDL